LLSNGNTDTYVRAKSSQDPPRRCPFLPVARAGWQSFASGRNFRHNLITSSGIEQFAFVTQKCKLVQPENTVFRASVNVCYVDNPVTGLRHPLEYR
jgi:hypothetical protein